MVALRLFDIEADLVDAGVDIEIQQCVRIIEAFFAQHGDDMEVDVVLAQQTNAVHRAVECASPMTGEPMRIMQVLRPVDADADPDLVVGETGRTKRA